MRVYQEIEQIRRELNIPEYQMCNILCVDADEYGRIISGQQKLSTFQLVMFVAVAKRPLQSI